MLVVNTIIYQLKHLCVKVQHTMRFSDIGFTGASLLSSSELAPAKLALSSIGKRERGVPLMVSSIAFQGSYRGSEKDFLFVSLANIPAKIRNGTFLFAP